MPDKNVDPGYKLPDTIDPGSNVCARVYIPNDALYIAAFWRAYEFFTTWLAWERDEAHRGKDAAAVWLAAFEQARAEWEAGGGCGLIDVRQKPGAPCTLQKTDDGDVWDDWAYLRNCIPQTRVANGVIQVQDADGNWQDTSTESYDERTDGSFTPAWEEPPPGEAGNCLAAANAAEILYTAKQVYSGAANLGALAFACLTEVIGVIIGIIDLTHVTFIIATGLALLYEELTATWQDVYDIDLRADLTCMLVCLYDETGVMWEADYASALAAITAKRNSYTIGSAERCAWGIVLMAATALGYIGMDRVANLAGITSYDCGGCDSCADWKHIWSGGAIGSSGDWAALLGDFVGNGYEWEHYAYDQESYLRALFADTVITRIRLKVDISSAPTGNDVEVRGLLNSTQIFWVGRGAFQGENWYEWAGNETLDEIELRGAIFPSGMDHVTTLEIQIEGMGPDPWL